MLTEVRDAIYQMQKMGAVVKEIEVDDKTYERLEFDFRQTHRDYSTPIPEKFRSFAMMEILGVTIIRSSLRNQVPADTFSV